MARTPALFNNTMPVNQSNKHLTFIDNNGAVDPIDVDSEEPGSPPSPARNCAGRKRQSKRPQKREDVTAVARSG